MQNKFSHYALLVLFSVLSLAACRPGTRYVYTGRVFDGLTNAALTRYTIAIRYGDVTLKGVVGSDGIYSVSDLPSLADFTVTITADGYRPFYSNNLQLPEGAAGTRVENVPVTNYRDAYVFPTSASAPAARVLIFLPDSVERPSGTARFVPTAPSALQDQDNGFFVNQTGAPASQARWTNSLDTQAPSLMKEFTNGIIDLADGELTLGVVYAIDLYGVPNYSINLGTGFAAGWNNNLAITLVRSSAPSDVLQIVRVNTDDGLLVDTGEFIVTFNNAIELNPAFTQAWYDQQVKFNLALTSPDFDGDAVVNALVPDNGGTPAVDERNARIASVTVDGNRLIFRSTLSGATMTTTDPQDPILSVTYCSLVSFPVRLAGRTDQAFEALSTVDRMDGGPDLGATETVTMRSQTATP